MKLAPWLVPLLVSVVVPPHAQAQSSAPALSPADLGTLAEVLQAPKSQVQSRLAADPGLGALTNPAIAAYRERRQSGKTQAILGFAIFGIGDIVASAILFTTPNYPDVHSKDNGRVLTALGIGVVTTALGAALAIPGILRFARRSPEERALLEAYDYPSVGDSRSLPLPPPEPMRPAAPEPQTSVPVFTVPLVALRF